MASLWVRRRTTGSPPTEAMGVLQKCPQPSRTHRAVWIAAPSQDRPAGGPLTLPSLCGRLVIRPNPVGPQIPARPHMWPQDDAAWPRPQATAAGLSQPRAFGVLGVWVQDRHTQASSGQAGSLRLVLSLVEVQDLQTPEQGPPSWAGGSGPDGRSWRSPGVSSFTLGTREALEKKCVSELMALVPENGQVGSRNLVWEPNRPALEGAASPGHPLPPGPMPGHGEGGPRPLGPGHPLQWLLGKCLHRSRDRVHQGGTGQRVTRAHSPHSGNDRVGEVETLTPGVL